MNDEAVKWGMGLLQAIQPALTTNKIIRVKFERKQYVIKNLLLNLLIPDCVTVIHYCQFGACRQR